MHETHERFPLTPSAAHTPISYHGTDEEALRLYIFAQDSKDLDPHASSLRKGEPLTLT